MDDLPTLNALRRALDFYSERQTLLAANVANADTPDYVPNDLDRDAFARELDRQVERRAPLSTRVTDDKHIYAVGAPRIDFTQIQAPDSETTLNGNAVVVEEQMAKVTETRMAYQSVVQFMDSTVGLLRVATSSPGRG
ncbi:MAG: flagellar basal body rod protein FlgB [Maricaulaceae bacterium]